MNKRKFNPRAILRLFLMIVLAVMMLAVVYSGYIVLGNFILDALDVTLYGDNKIVHFVVGFLSFLILCIAIDKI